MIKFNQKQSSKAQDKLIEINKSQRSRVKAKVEMREEVVRERAASVVITKTQNIILTSQGISQVEKETDPEATRDLRIDTEEEKEMMIEKSHIGIITDLEETEVIAVTMRGEEKEVDPITKGIGKIIIVEGRIHQIMREIERETIRIIEEIITREEEETLEKKLIKNPKEINLIAAALNDEYV